MVEQVAIPHPLPDALVALIAQRFRVIGEPMRIRVLDALRDGRDVYSWKLKALVKVGGGLARLVRFADLDDQVEACRRIFASDTRWTVVRGSDLEEGESQGLPVWSRHVGDPILASNITRRVDFARFMVDALQNDELIREAPAIVSRQSPSALAHAATITRSAAARESLRLEGTALSEE